MLGTQSNQWRQGGTWHCRPHLAPGREPRIPQITAKEESWHGSQTGAREVTEGELGPLYEQGAADGPLLSLSDCQEPEGSAKGWQAALGGVI